MNRATNTNYWSEKFKVAWWMKFRELIPKTGRLLGCTVDHTPRPTAHLNRTRASWAALKNLQQLSLSSAGV